MNLQDLIFDKKKVLDSLQVMEDKSLVAKSDIKIYFPSSWDEKGLAIIGSDKLVLFIVLIVVDDKYAAVVIVNAMIKLLPLEINYVDITSNKISEEHYEFVFPKGNTITPSLNLIRKDTLVYQIYNTFMSKGKMPLYIHYEMAGHLFDSAVKHANANIGKNIEITELILSLQARSNVDRTIYYRQVIQDKNEIKSRNYIWTALNNVRDSATNTTTRLGGSYYSEGVISALVNPSTRPERIESLLTA